MIRNTENSETKRPNNMEAAMESVRKARIVEVLLGFVMLVGVFFTLRTVQFSTSAFAGPKVGQALENYESRMHATQVLLETGRLENSGS
jgi:hypothetical protein